MPAALAVAAVHLQYNLMKFLSPIAIFLCLCVCGMTASAQRANMSGSVPKDVNKFDGEGKRHGVWLMSQEARMGEEGFSEFGNYEHGQKYGKWYKIDGEGDLISVENFRNDVLDGEVKYYDKGLLACIGNYRGLNPDAKFDTIMVVHPVTGAQELKSISTEKGTMRHGMWKFYDPQTGKLLKEEEYQVDELIYSRKFDLTKADSLATQAEIKKLPHSKGEVYKPPVNKQVSYMAH